MPAFKPPKPRQESSKIVITQEKPKEGQCPATLDIIKVDGRWAQVASIRDEEFPGSVVYLSDKSGSPWEPGSYKLKKVYKWMGDSPEVKAVLEAGMKFTPTELENIRWGHEQEKHPELKLLVKVFGEYESVKDSR